MRLWHLMSRQEGDDHAAERGQDRGPCQENRGGAQALARQARRVRPRRRIARQISCAREIFRGARRRLRLLRRGAGLGFQRPAVRQCQLHRLAHRLSGRTVPHRAGYLPRRCRSKATCCSSWRSSAGRPRHCVRAARSGACSSARRTWAMRRRRPANTSSSCSRRRRIRCARRATRTSRTSLPASSAIRCCARRFMRSSTSTCLSCAT